MTALKSILVVIERSEHAHAVFAKACILARHLGARIELFICDAERAYALQHSYDQSGLHRALDAAVLDNKRYLDALLARHSADDLDIRINASCENPLYEGVVHEVLNTCPDLVMKSLGFHTRNHRAWPSDNDWQLARTCPAPLMLTREHAWHATPRIAACVDVSAKETPGLAAQILETTTTLGRAFDGQVELIYSQRDASRIGEHTALHALAAQFHIADSEIHVLSGDPSDTLADFSAARHYDLIALGALTHHADMTTLVGRVTDCLLQRVDCDFLLMKPETFRCPVRLPLEAQQGGQP